MPIFAQQPIDDAQRPPAPPIAAPIFPAQPQMPDDAQAYPNEGGPGAMVMNAIHSLFTLPQRAIDASSQDVQNLGDHSKPLQSIGPALETAATMIGGGFAGTGERTAGQVIGSGMIPGTGPEAKAAWSALRQQQMENKAALKRISDAIQSPVEPHVDPFAGMNEDETARAFEMALRQAANPGKP